MGLIPFGALYIGIDKSCELKSTGLMFKFTLMKYMLKS